ncbi:toll-like receptor 9 [Amia ocellicauda]|uniref:toll-like receptor 9 n=1 Tax=Amia ocellicauda TaxID=2972642 RepID=UPI003464CCFF
MYPSYLPCSSLQHKEVDCTAHDLTSVPQFSSPTEQVQTLLLSENRIARVSGSSFLSFPHLRSLNLSWNCPPPPRSAQAPCRLEIDKGALISLQELRYLDLRGNGLAGIPELPGSLQHLYLSSNSLLFSEPPPGPPLAQLQRLHMDNNCYYKNPCGRSQATHPLFFTGMQQLRFLSLGNNNLTAVPKHLPPTMRKLALPYNHIEAISPGDFAQLPNLTKLDLSSNCRRCEHASDPCVTCSRTSLLLAQNCFSNLCSLQWLDLSDNSLTALNESVFAPLKSLEVLYLRDNSLNKASHNKTNLTLGSPAFRFFPQLKKLDLSYNYRNLTIFQRLALTEDFRHLRQLVSLIISGCFFRTVDAASIKPLSSLPNLERLELRLNFINKVKLQTFHNISLLKYLGLAENEITFPVLRDHRGNAPHHFGSPQNTLRASSSALQDAGHSDPPGITSPIHLMQSCRSNNTLNLRRNNLVFIKKELFEGLEHIECLILSYNSISQSFTGHEFTSLRSLRVLDLSYNRINLYFKEAFSELQQLEVLDLSHNNYHFEMNGMGHKLTFIAGLPSLKILNLGFNSIKDRITTALQSTSLEVLIFRKNRLDIMWDKELYSRFFQNLTSLIELDLSMNQLTHIPPEVLLNLPPTVRNLSLQNNKLTTFPWEALSALPALERLDLSSNLFSVLSRSTLPGLYFPPHASIQSLNVSFNKINRIDRDFFKNATQLSKLLLSDNEMREVDFTDCLLTRLEVLDIRRNSLSCSCDSTLYTFVSKFNFSIPALTNQVTCGSPEELRGKSIFSKDAKLCQGTLSLLFFLFSSLLIVLFTLLPLLKQLLGWDVWYTFYVWVAQSWGSLYRCGASKEYDAFVVFDKEQESVSDWVYNELRVQLEEGGLQSFKLCLEERDWIPGQSAIENLYDAVHNSKKTVFILSGDQSASGVLREAFFMTQQRLLDDSEDVAVFVLLGRTPRGSRFLKLRRLLCRETVLLWPNNPHAQGYFWHRLRCILRKDIWSSYDRKFSLGFEGS